MKVYVVTVSLDYEGSWTVAVAATREAAKAAAAENARKKNFTPLAWTDCEDETALSNKVGPADSCCRDYQYDIEPFEVEGLSHWTPMIVTVDPNHTDLGTQPWKGYTVAAAGTIELPREVKE